MIRFSKKQITLIFAGFVILFQIIFGHNPNFSFNLSSPTPLPTLINQSAKAKVIRVIDGDTIEIEGKIKVRYIGVNTPEIYHDTTGKKTAEQCFAEESYLENKRLVEGKTATLIKDISDKDKYGRLLRYVYIDDIFVNDYLIRQGFAKIMIIKPDVNYQQLFKEAQKDAKDNNLGLWKNCL